MCPVQCNVTSISDEMKQHTLTVHVSIFLNISFYAAFFTSVRILYVLSEKNL